MASLNANDDPLFFCPHSHLTQPTPFPHAAAPPLRRFAFLPCPLAPSLAARSALCAPIFLVLFLQGHEGAREVLDEKLLAAAAEWRAEAARGKAQAQLNLGVAYERGQGVAYDMAESLRHYRLAADQGAAEAQHRLGLVYARGKGGVPADATEAAAWFAKAADQGHERARGELEKLGQRDDG